MFFFEAAPVWNQAARTIIATPPEKQAGSGLDEMSQGENRACPLTGACKEYHHENSL
jgi:hypothetical protein